MKKQLLVTAMASSMALAGCATQNGTNGFDLSNVNKAVLGAAAGAAAGYGISKATGGEHEGRDALIGAALGAGVGLYMQNQAAQLEKQMAGTGVDVSYDPNTNNINVTMPNNVTFATNSAVINTSDAAELDKLAATLTQYDQTNIVVVGHTDSTGGPAINQPLSVKRANSVANYLYQKGVGKTRLYVDGKGATQPIATNATEAGKAKNRRVEIEIKAPQSIS
ncbi:OmpA family protein [Psychrobacter sp. HD31]|uniref:OmpA family protein n=1 Tax=Psychrobacter sp. HD31 TaxID=3112003 RepID=UPI003DA48F94